MKVKYTDIPSYEQVEIAAKTTRAVCGTIDRKLVGRCLITTQAGFTGKHMVVNGDGTPIVSVKEIGEGEGKAAELELFVELVGGKRSLASFKFYAGYVADNRENAGVTDVFTENGDQVARIADCAERMCDAHPECDGQWKIVDKDGKRHFLRKISTDINASGKIEE